MTKLKTYFRRFFYNLKNGFFSFENIVLFVALILCLGWTYGAISAMTRNWILSRTYLEKEYEKKIAMEKKKGLEEQKRNEEKIEIRNRKEIEKIMEQQKRKETDFEW